MPPSEDCRPHTSAGFYASQEFNYDSFDNPPHRAPSRGRMLSSADDIDRGYFGPGGSRLKAIASHRHYSPGSGLPMQPGCVILLYGLADQWNCDKLFSILCMYGNVVRVCISLFFFNLFIS